MNNSNNTDTSINQRYNFKKIVGLLLPLFLLAVLLVAGFFALKAMQKTSPEDHFRKAVLNSMSESYKELSYVDKSSEGDSTLTVNVDYSDIKNVNLTGSGELVSEAEGIKIKFSSVTDKDNVYLNFGAYEFSEESVASPEVLDTWIQFPKDVSELDPFYPYDFGLAAAMTSVATPVGEIPDGNFTKEQRTELEEILIDGGAYTIKSYTEEKLGDRDVIKYVVSLDDNKILEANELVAEYADIPDIKDLEQASVDIEGTVEMYVLKDASRFTRFDVDIDAGHTQTVMVGNHGKKFDITIPEEFITKEEFSRGIDQQAIDRALSIPPELESDSDQPNALEA